MFSIFSKKLEKRVLVFALETGSTTLTLVETKKGGEEKILFYTRHSTSPNTNDSPTDLLRKAVAKIPDCFQDLKAKKAEHFLKEAKVFVLLGSAFNIYWKKKLEIREEKAFKLSKAMIEKKIQETFGMEYKYFKIISTHVTSVLVNGYKLKNPIGKTTDHASLEVFLEASAEEVLKEVEKPIRSVLPHAELRFTGLAYAASEAVLESSEKQNFMFILPEDILTELMIVKHGRIEAGGSLPFGSLTIAEKIFGKSSIAKDSLAMAKRVIKGNADDGSVEQAKKNAGMLKEVFGSELRNLLWEMNESALCPNDVFIGGKSVASHFFYDWIDKEEYASQSFTADCLKPSIISGKDLKEGKRFPHKNLPFVCAVSAHVAKLFTKSFEVEEK